MGPISQYLRNKLATELRAHQVVVWYDAAGAFESFVRSLQIPRTRILTYEGSYFGLRRDAEDLLASLRDGKPASEQLLLYIPRAPLDPKKNILLPVEVVGTVFSDGLDAVARQALADKVPPEKIEQWLSVEGMTLERLDEVAAGEEDIGPLTTVFGRVGPQEVGYLFLRDENYLEALKEHRLLPALREVLERTFGVAIAPELRSPGKVRDAFAQRVLLHEFLSDLGERPRELAHLTVPEHPAQLAACRNLATRLRESKALETEYREWARAAESLFGLREIDYAPERLGAFDTFEFQAEAALDHARHLATSGHWQEAREWVAQRSRSFWVSTDERFKSRWQVLSLAIELRLTAERAIAAIPGKHATVREWLEWYAGPGEEAGWRVDRLLRSLDALSVKLIDHRPLEEVVLLARDRGQQAEQLIAERFWDRASAAPNELADVPLQTDIFHTAVAPFLRRPDGTGHRVVFVLADALRYEMAQELAELLATSGEVELSYACATPPTLTKIGMAALVPGAEKGIQLVVRSGSLVARIDGMDLPTIEQRRKKFESTFGARIVDITLDSCLSKNASQLERKIGNADLVVLRSQELDAIGELDNFRQARMSMGQVIPDLQMAIARLTNLGFSLFVITADHGFLLRDDIDEAMKLDLPQGEIVEAHRRCVVGRHLGRGPNHAVFRAADLGLQGDLELAFPRGINVFRVPGNTMYHHGGLSPQELVVPLLRYTPAVRGAEPGRPTVTLELKGGSKVTNTIFQVQLSVDGDLFGQDSPPRRYRVTAVKDDQVIGSTIQATEGFVEAGGEVELPAGGSSVLIIYLAAEPTGTGEFELVVADVDAGETILRRKVKYDLAF